MPGALPKTFSNELGCVHLGRLFSYVGQDTETFVIMGSPDIMTRRVRAGNRFEKNN